MIGGGVVFFYGYEMMLLYVLGECKFFGEWLGFVEFMYLRDCMYVVDYGLRLGNVIVFVVNFYNFFGVDVKVMVVFSLENGIEGLFR